MSVRDELHHLVETLDDDEVQEALDYLRWLAHEKDTLTEAEQELVKQGEAELASGDYVTLDDLRRELET